MRSCEEMELLMNLYLDNLLPSEEVRLLNEHLKECQVCRERFHQLSTIKDALGEMEEPVPEGLHERILDYVEKNGPESVPAVSADPKIIRPRRWLRTLTTVAACAVIAVAAIRFVPDLTFQNAETLPVPDTYNTIMENDFAAPESAPAAPQEPVQIPAAPPPVQMNELQSPPASQEKDLLPQGPLAEDLPPLIAPNHRNDEQITVRKWLKAEGTQDQLPEWVTPDLMHFTDDEQHTHTYVVIDHWIEDYWKDQLTPCGFVFSDLEGVDLTEDGEKILIFFVWTE